MNPVTRLSTEQFCQIENEKINRLKLRRGPTVEVLNHKTNIKLDEAAVNGYRIAEIEEIFKKIFFVFTNDLNDHTFSDVTWEIYVENWNAVDADQWAEDTMIHVLDHNECDCNISTEETDKNDVIKMICKIETRIKNSTHTFQPVDEKKAETAKKSD